MNTRHTDNDCVTTFRLDIIVDGKAATLLTCDRIPLPKDGRVKLEYKAAELLYKAPDAPEEEMAAILDGMKRTLHTAIETGRAERGAEG